MRAREVGAGEVSAGEIGTEEIASRQLGALEVEPAQIELTQVLAAEIDGMGGVGAEEPLAHFVNRDIGGQNRRPTCEQGKRSQDEADAHAVSSEPHPSIGRVAT